MHILIGVAVLALVAGMVCIWLTGNPFGRVLAFLVLAVVLAAVGAVVAGDLEHPNLIGLLIGVALAWPVSGIPIYVRRAQAKAAG